MEWNYERTAKVLTAQFRAQAKTKGTALHGRLMATRLLLAAVLLVTLFLSCQHCNLPTVMALLAVFGLLYAVIWVMGPTASVWGEMWFLHRNGMMKSSLGPQHIVMKNGIWKHECIQPDGGEDQAQWSCADILGAGPVDGGLQIVLRGGRTDFLPLSVFNEQHSLPACADAILAAAEAARRAPAAPLPEDATERTGFVPDGKGGATVRFTLAPAQVATLLSECERELQRHAVYWTAQLAPLLLVAIIIVLMGILRPAFALFLLVLSAALFLGLILVRPSVRRHQAARGTLDVYSGPQTIQFDETGLHIHRQNGNVDEGYATYCALMETEHAVFLTRNKPLSMLPIPKEAFATREEQDAFCSLLRARLETAEAKQKQAKEAVAVPAANKTEQEPEPRVQTDTPGKAPEQEAPPQPEKNPTEKIAEPATDAGKPIC